MSPKHVKPSDRVWERAVGRLLEERGYEYVIPEDEYSRWDLRALNLHRPARDKARPWILAEVKRRPIDWEGRFFVGDYKSVPIDGPLINIDKAVDLIRMSGEQTAVVANGNTQGPVWFVCVPNDLIARFAWLTTERIATFAIDRKDSWTIRPRGDITDTGKVTPKYVIPFERFHYLGKVTPE